MQKKRPAKSRDRVWLVGGSDRDSLADVYDSKEGAERAVMRYIFEDENDHWIGKLSPKHRKIVETLRDQPELAIDAYNSFASEADQWIISECEVRQ